MPHMVTTGGSNRDLGRFSVMNKLGNGIGSNAGKPRVASESESVVVPAASFCAHFDPRASSGPRVCMDPLAALASLRAIPRLRVRFRACRKLPHARRRGRSLLRPGRVAGRLLGCSVSLKRRISAGTGLFSARICARTDWAHPRPLQLRQDLSATLHTCAGTGLLLSHICAGNCNDSE